MPNQGDPNLTTSTITLEFDDGAGNIYTVLKNVIWIPEIKIIATPQPPNATGNGFQTNSPYYYSYSF